MKATAVFSIAIALLAAPLAAGVVFEVETKDHDASPPRAETTEVSAEGKNLKMDVTAGERGGTGKAIFRGDRGEMVITDDQKKEYVVLDRQAMEQLAAQLGAVSSQIAEALKSVPEGQRAAVEQMMKQRMPQQAPERPVLQVRNTGERGEHADYPCVKYVVTRDGRTVRELWVTPWANIEGGEEAAEAFLAMADFMSELLEALPAGGGPGGLTDNPFIEMKELDGFPVVTRNFDEGGGLEDESTLRSARRRTIDPSEFEPPAGYKRRSMLGPP